MKLKSKKLLLFSTLTLLTSITTTTLVSCSKDSGDVITPPSNDQPNKDDLTKEQDKPNENKEVVIRNLPDILDEELNFNLVPLIRYIKGIENLKELDGEGNETDKLISPEEMLARYQEIWPKFWILSQSHDKDKVEWKDYRKLEYSEIVEKAKQKHSVRDKEGKYITPYDFFMKSDLESERFFRNELIETRTDEGDEKITLASRWSKKLKKYYGDFITSVEDAENLIIEAMPIVYAENIIQFMLGYLEFKITLLKSRTSQLTFKEYFKANTGASHWISIMLAAYNDFLIMWRSQYMRSTKEMFVGHGETYWRLLLDISNNEIAPFSRAMGNVGFYTPEVNVWVYRQELVDALLIDKFKQTVYTDRDILEKTNKTETENLDSVITRYKTRFKWLFKTSKE
ncbi:hypothetical protein [Mycoplasmopsis agassizii]|uniref:Lipoprotein n=1 Tax=Mycoplasmopsis agassizii TaxID=33922 RepID=A0ABX4H4M8_9BACT|nr:hypothetical protein [Mycoplasmopsis agassizii]PAF54818.1 hypothetical protein CJF60_03725 [Mycoplasmopsis agassizii]SMC19315.1 hypothetical protein SAMN02745179_00888 [Mycoplasmopsis agassizii]